MKIVFMGTPDFAQKSLEAIHNAGYEIIAVVTNPDKPKGRGMKMIPTPVKQYALKYNFPIYQPLKIRNNIELIKEIENLNPDVLCVVAYGKILPKEILDIPRYGAINVHGSLLPKYRGAAPIQWAVLNGEKETGITTMFMDEGMDTGDMILKEKVPIEEDETTGELWEKLSAIGAKLLVKTLEKVEDVKNDNEIIEITNKITDIESKKIIENNTDEANLKSKIKDNPETNDFESELKDDSEVNILKAKLKEIVKNKIHAEKQGNDFTTAPMLNKEMAKIDWNKSAQEIKNLVRGLNPIMGAYTILNNKKVKIWKVEIISENPNNEKKIDEFKNGEVVLASKKKGLFIKTSDGIIKIIETQPENSKKMDATSFLNGNFI